MDTALERVRFPAKVSLPEILMQVSRTHAVTAESCTCNRPMQQPRVNGLAAEAKESKISTTVWAYAAPAKPF